MVEALSCMHALGSRTMSIAMVVDPLSRSVQHSFVAGIYNYCNT